jgi:regulatory protein
MTDDLAPRLTGVTPDPRRPHCVRLAVDGRPFGVAAADAVAALGISPGDELTPETLARLTGLTDDEAAFRAGLTALSHRPRATADLGRRLVRSGHPPASVEHALGRLTTLGLLDDATFAENYVETRSERGRGPARLLRDLRLLGVDSDVASAAIAAHWPDDEGPAEAALQLAQRRAPQLAHLERPVQRRRLLAFLARRGFTGPTALDAVRRVLAGSATHA